MQIHSGYKTITPIQLANALSMLQEGQIDFRSMRVYLACFALVAVREAATRYRCKRHERPRHFARYRIRELERITTLNRPIVRRALRQLQRSNLATFGEGKVNLCRDELPGSQQLQAALACRRSPRRPIPMPRSMLRFLAQNRSEALAKVIIAYTLRGLAFARATGAILAKGTVKASWIARNFGLSPRAVKYAQATLRQLAWISKDTQSHQRKLNRDGSYFAINLTWAPPSRPTQNGGSFVNRNKSTMNFAPPKPGPAHVFAPLIEYKITSIERIKDRETRHAESTVVGVCTPINSTFQNHLAPTLDRIVLDDLWRFGRLERLYFQAVDRGWIESDEATTLNFIAAAVRARELGRSPARLFVALVRKRLWHHISQAQEDRARSALIRFREINPNCFRVRERDSSTSNRTANSERPAGRGGESIAACE